MNGVSEHVASPAVVAPTDSSPVTVPVQWCHAALDNDARAKVERHANCFDALRLLLAACVLYSHSWLLGGFGTEPFHRWSKHQAIAGELGVLGFFGLSGFLVAASFERSRSAVDFLARRLRRILPGYWACLLVTALLLAPATYFFSNGSLAGYHWFGDGSAASYVVQNAALKIHAWSIAGVLDRAPYSDSLNGSLWSLFPEFCCYLGLGCVGITGALQARRHLLLTLTGFGLLYHAANIVRPDAGTPLLPAPVVLTNLAPFAVAFSVGACAHVWRSHLAPGWPAALLLAIVCGVLLRLGGFQLVAPLLVPLLVIHIGLAFSLPLGVDWSYGLYIYAFPIQQLLAMVPGLRTHWVVYFVSALALSLLFAAASWHVVERRWLRPVK